MPLLTHRSAPSLLGLPLAVALSGCFAPKAHSIDPYRSDYEAGVQLQRRAAAVCESADEGERKAPDKTFITDGCSAWFNGSWGECCVTHDIDYWCGGTAEDRKQADRELRACVKETTDSSFFAQMIYMGVRVGGHPIFPLHYRWGFGHEDYRPWYDDATCEMDSEEPPAPH